MLLRGLDICVPCCLSVGCERMQWPMLCVREGSLACAVLVFVGVAMYLLCLHPTWPCFLLRFLHSCLSPCTLMRSWNASLKRLNEGIHAKSMCCSESFDMLSSSFSTCMPVMFCQFKKQYSILFHVEPVHEWGCLQV